jgi:hypothetical protein
VTGRLELDDSGRVVGAVDDPVDIGPPPEPAVREPGPIARRLGPVARRHRRSLIALAAGAVAASVAIGWWSGRPPETAPVVALELTSAVLPGNSIGGPEISPDGSLRVAFAARATSGTQVRVTGLEGPGLASSTVAAPAIDDAGLARLEASARVDCADPGLLDARPQDYGLAVTATSSSGRGVDGSVPLAGAVPGDRTVTRLNLAVADWCLARSSVEVLEVSATPVPGVPLADLAVRVRNTGSQPLALATDRTPGPDVEVDLSPEVVVAPSAEGVLSTRVAVRDCSDAPALTTLAELPNPVGDGGGLTLVLRTGGTYALRSVAVPDAEALGARLGSSLCADAPRATAAVAAVSRVATTPGSWQLRATLDVRTDGVGVRVGRERFVGPPAGEGSFLGVVERATPDGPWDAAPARLDGGAGRLVVDLAGGGCASLSALAPGTLPLRVLTADGRVYPFELPFDDVRLVRAAYAACAREPAPAAALVERGWLDRPLGLPGGTGA